MSVQALTSRHRNILHARSIADAGGLWLWIFSLLPPFVLMLAVALQPWVAPGDLLRDPLAVAEMSETCCKVYFGAVSSLGVLVWSAGAAVCMFTAALIYRLRGVTADTIFMLSAGLLTAVMVIDDLYLVHENVLPALGVPQPITYAAYGLCGLIYVLLSWRRIMSARYVLLAAAIGLLATSVTIDWFFHSDHALRILLEDGAKLVGIFAWTAFHAAAAWALIVQNLLSPQSRYFPQ